MLNYNMQSLAFSPIPEQNPIEAYGNMLHSDGFISVSGINRRKICRSVPDSVLEPSVLFPIFVRNKP